MNFVIKEDIEFVLEKFSHNVVKQEEENEKVNNMCEFSTSENHKTPAAFRPRVCHIDPLQLLSNVEAALFGIAPALIGAIIWVFFDGGVLSSFAGDLFKAPVILSGSICGIGFFGNMALAAGPFGMKNTTVMLLLGNVITAVFVQLVMSGPRALYLSFEWVSTIIVSGAVTLYFSPNWYAGRGMRDGKGEEIEGENGPSIHVESTAVVNLLNPENVKV